MDELGRGTSTFDGTAIASATVKHLVERSKCISLFATHYHSLLEEWETNPHVLLGHMECVVDNGNVSARSHEADESSVTFLYTLGAGGCPKSFGINVARLARLPDDVLSRAKHCSAEFEDQTKKTAINARTAPLIKKRIMEALQEGRVPDIKLLCEELKM